MALLMIASIIEGYRIPAEPTTPRRSYRNDGIHLRQPAPQAGLRRKPNARDARTRSPVPEAPRMTLLDFPPIT
jgi:hypothetical protein